MNAAEIATVLVIEETLQNSSAYRKVDERLHVVKQGSAYVMINVVPWGKDKCMVRCVAQLLRGVELSQELATQLMTLNGQLRFGAFAYDPQDQLILFVHSILGGTTLDPEELLATVSDVALISDEYDDKIMKKYGGQTMRELLEEAALERVLDANPEDFDFSAKA